MNRQVVVGLVMIAVGLAISLGTYASASDGESYMVMWGLPLVGAINVVKGLSGRR